jgi:hypothetical protein
MPGIARSIKSRDSSNSKDARNSKDASNSTDARATARLSEIARKRAAGRTPMVAKNACSCKSI